MIIDKLVLQHFRSYAQETFSFSPQLTVVIGPNTAGKTNLTEAMQLLSYGKTFAGQSDKEVVQFEKDIARVQGLVDEGDMQTKLEVIVLSPQVNNGRFGKKFLVNGVGKSRNNFIGHLPLVVFRPEELDIVIAGPSHRRNFLDSVLEMVDHQYVLSLTQYEKALRQRNALLDRAQETGQKNIQQFSYWDNLLIEHGTYIHQKRAAFITYCNEAKKDVFSCELVYDHSIVSVERLKQYEDAELAAGNTLVGPHRDDMTLIMKDSKKEKRDIKLFGSRGQQRLVVLQLKLLQIAYVEQELSTKPLLITDDIFSELDSGHISLVLEKTEGQQVILTTTHKEFITSDVLQNASVIELKKTHAAI